MSDPALTADDRLDIVELVTRLDDLATRRDADGYAALYTADGRMSGTEGDAVGREAIARAVTAVWAAEPSGSVHVPTAITVAAVPTGVTATSVLLVLLPQPPTLVAMASVVQAVVRTADGWRVAHRRIG